MLADETLRILAHQIWETEGYPQGRALDHWLEAQRLALSPNVVTPWYDAGTMVNETDWMRRALWHPQPFGQH